MTNTSKHTPLKIGAVVRRLRKQSGLTLQALSDLIPGYDTGNLSRFERDEQGIEPEKLRLIAEILKIPVHVIYYQSECDELVATSLPERLRISLKQSDLTITDLANKAKVSQSAVSQWLSGETKKIASDNLFDAAKALSVNPEWLATGKGPMSDTAVINGNNLLTKADRIKIARLNSDLTQQQLADLMDVTKAAVSSWETGKIQSLMDENILHLAEACQVNPDWLSSGRGDMYPSKSKTNNEQFDDLSDCSFFDLMDHDDQVAPTEQKIIDVLIASGLVTQEKIDQIRQLITD